jgi:hypothetical protein
MRDRKQRCLGVPFVLRRHPWMALGMLVAMALIVGCARQYHWYRCGCDCVNYNYCPPAPLPYSPYCSCPTPVSSSYHRLLQSEPTAAASPDDPAALRETADPAEPAAK